MGEFFELEGFLFSLADVLGYKVEPKAKPAQTSYQRRLEEDRKTVDKLYALTAHQLMELIQKCDEALEHEKALQKVDAKEKAKLKMLQILLNKEMCKRAFPEWFNTRGELREIVVECDKQPLKSIIRQRNCAMEALRRKILDSIETKSVHEHRYSSKLTHKI